MSFPQPPGAVQPRILSQKLSDTTVVNTVAETTLASFATPGELLPSQHLRIRLAGELFNNTSGNINCRFFIKLGGTTIFTSSNGTIPVGANLRRWAMLVDFGLATLASQRAFATLSIGRSLASNFTFDSSNNFLGAGTNDAFVDLSQTVPLLVTVQLSVADTNAKIVCHAATLELVPFIGNTSSGPVLTLVAADNYQRSNRPLLNDLPLVGPAYTRGNAINPPAITNDLYTMTDETGFGTVTTIAYLQLFPTPSKIEASAIFVPNTGGSPTLSGRAIIGVTPSAGFGSGSVQLDIKADNTYRIFVVTNPIVDPYITLISGPMSGVIADGVTSYPFAMERNADTVTAYLPDGQVVSASSPLVSQYWGAKFGIQIARPLTTDDIVRFSSIGAWALT